MLSKKSQFAFIHIPKTAGTSVYRALGGDEDRDPLFGYSQNLGLQLQHLTAQEYVSYGFIDELEFKDYFKFCFVRNPWERLVSEWMWRTNNVPRYSIHRYFRLSLKSFFLKVPNWRGIAGSRIRRHVMPQYHFIYDDEGKLLVDYVARFENLKSDFDRICDRLGLDRTALTWTNSSQEKTERKDYRAYYDDETYQMVKDFYIKDIEYFGYEF
ncbi:MAG: sulfotransferase family 2 domain-containing protein [Cyanobacteria bacterium P01_G01_bin.19]